jgi:hypothetical protein
MYVHGGLVNEEIGFHTIINLTGLSAPSSIFERFFFGEPVSGSMKVIFLVEHNG